MKFLDKYEKKIKGLNRWLSRCQKGSKNREKEEITDIEVKLKKKTNHYVCEQVELNGVHYQICKDIMQQLLIYRKENDQYVDLKFEDFEVIFNYIGKEIL